jgi:hypothetical protein
VTTANINLSRPWVIGGIDPGADHSGVAILDGLCMVTAHILPNVELLGWLEERCRAGIPAQWVIEAVQGMSRPMGRQAVSTVEWGGRFIQLIVTTHPREDKAVAKLTNEGVRAWFHPGGGAKMKHVRQGLYERFSTNPKAALGTTKKPGPLRGLNPDPQGPYKGQDHALAAFAVAVAWREINLGPLPGDKRLSVPACGRD